ncbi:hypothetical protein RFI_03060, partial [Reticulomyxa filosa]
KDKNNKYFFNFNSSFKGIRINKANHFLPILLDNNNNFFFLFALKKTIRHQSNCNTIFHQINTKNHSNCILENAFMCIWCIDVGGSHTTYNHRYGGGHLIKLYVLMNWSDYKQITIHCHLFRFINIMYNHS